MRFEIQPSSIAEELATNWSNALSVKAIYTKTRAASAGESVALDIESATASDGILSITISAKGLDDKFFDGTLPANARLKISDGSNEVLSSYIKLLPEQYTIPIEEGDYVDKNGINFGKGIVIDGVTWAPVNCGTTTTDLYGSHYTFDKAQSACPDGWRTPTIDELNSLVAHYSEWTTNNNGTQGRWVSGSKSYSSSVTALFLPAMSSTATGSYWSSTKYGTSNGYGVSLKKGTVYQHNCSKTYTHSVRCLKK